MAIPRRRFISAGLGGAFLALTPRWPLQAQAPKFTTDPFSLGVASGYPEPGAVTLWTRLAPQPLAPGGGMPPTIVPVEWEVAADERFASIVRTGTEYATPDQAHSVHAEVSGLEPRREYWYRFSSGGARSATGRTLTAPARSANVDQMRVAVACCQHYETGNWAAYRDIAASTLDLVVHVGDYIYEQRGLQPGPNGTLARSHDLSEPYTLDDYRRRYALYKLDAHLQAAHASAPWMVTWDDHEVDNDYAGAVSEEDDEPTLFLARRAAAYQAYYEHMPLPRRHVPFGAHQRLYSGRQFGSLLDLMLLDGRQYRSPHACKARLAIDCDEVFDPRRTMLGEMQERWVDESLARSQARWSVIAQQTIFARIDQAPGEPVGYWADGWSGYAAAQQRLIERFRAHEIRNPVVLSGDVHAFMVNDVSMQPGVPESPIAATELVTTSISSPGPPQSMLDGWLSENANVRLARSDLRGYTRLTLRPQTLLAELVAVDDVRRADSQTRTFAEFLVEDGRPGVVR